MSETRTLLQRNFHFFQQPDLVYRLSRGLERRDREVIFLVGSGLSAPAAQDGPGVPSTEGIIDLIRSEFTQDQAQLISFNNALDAAGAKRYQAAFLFLLGRLGQGAANEIVRKAVFKARLLDAGLPGAPAVDLRVGAEEEFRVLDLDSHWHLNPGTEALGKLIAEHSRRFGRAVLTTNFDPLIEVAVNKAGGQFFKTSLHADGNLLQTIGAGCHIIHLHGYWHGSDTLHTVGQLQHARPHLRASLASLLRDKLLVVCGYGGWDDIFTEAIFDVVADDNADIEILWSFYSQTPQISESLENRLATGFSRGRVSLYGGVDCNTFLPALYQEWFALEPGTRARTSGPANTVRVSSALRMELERGSDQRTLEGDDEDRPPLVHLCVGRERELQLIANSNASVLFVTGIGGQGKSTLAAQYFATAQREHSYNYYVWRDCKEEGERFENQLASVIETLSGGRISAQDLAKQDIQSIVQVFMTLTVNTSVLLVFDNTDHYVNLETGRMTSSADVLIRELLSAGTSSRIFLTCRPTVDYRHSAALSCHLEGISLEATRQLFRAREAECSEEEIVHAHIATEGHAFWLDLLALQVAKSPNSLRDLLDGLANEGGFLPEKALAPIWETLDQRQQLVLRSMAEAVRPETETEIANYLRNKVNYRKVLRALNALRSMNLVVVKRRPTNPDVHELHPIVRQFVWRRFNKLERSSFINEIVKVFRHFIVTHRSELDEHPTFSVLQYWTHAAELDLAAGRIGSAIATLVEAGEAFASSGYPREFSRAARLLLNSFDWISDHSRHKGFDALFVLHIENLCHLGEWNEAERLLDKFELSVVERDARYILYCKLKCHSKWTQGEFAEAVRWGKIGQTLKESSNVDTQYDVAHQLALAERDAGQPELALPVFLNERPFEEVTDPDELDEDQDGAHYGNIGRCLHFMGQVDSALICYQKSALLIERQPKHQHVLNQGYIRRWIGELLVARQEYKLAAVFLEAARLKWLDVSPPKAAQIIRLKRQLGSQLPDISSMSNDEIERTCLDWISGRIHDV